MSELIEILEALKAELPSSVRKTLETADENGWQLNKPGMTLALRLNHPTDELAMPCYISWQVALTAAGKPSMRFVSAGTRGLHSLKGKELLEYLADPTIVYPDDSDESEVPPSLQSIVKASDDQTSSESSSTTDSTTPTAHLAGTAVAVRSMQTTTPVQATTPASDASSATDVVLEGTVLTSFPKSNESTSIPQSGLRLSGRAVAPSTPNPAKPQAGTVAAAPLRVGKR